MIELLGFVASAVIVLSLTMTSIVKLRLVGLVGAVLFGIYGVLVGSWPVTLTNGVIVGLHLYFLAREWNDDEYFTLLEVRPDARYLLEFLDFHSQSIREFQPEFVYEQRDDLFTMFILRDMVPAGLFIADHDGGPAMQVLLDHVVARYRDLKSARFLFHHNREVFTSRGVEVLRATARTERHRRYLEKIGFVATHPGSYEMELRP